MTASRTLASLLKGEHGVVQSVQQDDSATMGNVEGSTMARRLLEIGFVPGERVEVLATAWPAGDPMAVRVGSSVFALRRREARAVLLQP
jgi:ferrous iron transport protein A